MEHHHVSLIDLNIQTKFQSN